MGVYVSGSSQNLKSNNLDCDELWTEVHTGLSRDSIMLKLNCPRLHIAYFRLSALVRGRNLAGYIGDGWRIALAGFRFGHELT